ncbi:hypothetical protein AAT19DRAFT_11937 [Rhodotorula toruloides]|uniref:RRM domain-containing protein n=1 Tax=Rhodotorula toruloides TaxID=5286 RepID=A0A2T0AET2_RHOTO|nr:hypothetical protein AAT19DRAFT_11937 [Rhodotorula toruloides]
MRTQTLLPDTATAQESGQRDVPPRLLPPSLFRSLTSSSPPLALPALLSTRVAQAEELSVRWAVLSRPRSNGRGSKRPSRLHQEGKPLPSLRPAPAGQGWRAPDTSLGHLASSTMNTPTTTATPYDAVLASLNSTPPRLSQDLVDHLVQACDEQDVLYVVFWLRKMNDKGLLWSVGGKDGVDAPHTWKGVSALQLVSTSHYTPLRHFILEVLLLNLEQPHFSSIQPALKTNCGPTAQWAKDVARRVVDSRGQSAVKARELLALTDDGSAASWIDANLPPCPTPDEQLTGFKALPPPPAASVPNGLPQPLTDDTRTPSPPMKLNLPVVKIVPPTPQAAARVANVLDSHGPPPLPVDHEDSTKVARSSSSASEDSLRVAMPLDRRSPVEEGEIRLTFSSEFEATQAEHSREVQPVTDEVPLDIKPKASLPPSHYSQPVSKHSPPPPAPPMTAPTLPLHPHVRPVGLYLTNLPNEANKSSLRNFVSKSLGLQHITQPRVLMDAATRGKRAWLTVADHRVAAQAAKIAEDEVVEWSGRRVKVQVVAADDGPKNKSGKSFGYAPKRAGSEPAAVEPNLKQELEEADFARNHPVWHSASPELERKPGLPDRKNLLNCDGEEFPKVKIEDEDVKMADEEEEAKPSPPQDLPFSLPFLASTSAAPAVVHSPSYASPSPTPPPSHFFAGYKAPENPYRSRSPVDRSRPYRSSPPPPHRLSPILGPSKLSQEFLKDEEGVAPRPTHSSPYPSPELSPPPAVRPLPNATPSTTVPWATSPVSPDLTGDEVEANPFAALFASSISPAAPSVPSSPVPPAPKPALRSSLKRSAPSAFSADGSRDTKRRRTEKTVHWAKEIAVVVGHGAGHVAEVEELTEGAAKQQPGGWSEKRVGGGLRW